MSRRTGSAVSLFLMALFLAALPLAAASTNPQHFSSHPTDSDSRDQAQLLVMDQAGNMFTVSAKSENGFPAPKIRIIKTDPSGNVLAILDFGGSSVDVANAAAIDPQGNLVVAGSATSTDFPLIAPLQSSGGAFVTKVDAQLGNLLYSTRLGVSGSRATAVTLDAEGDIFVAGDTPPGFPVTSGVLQTQSPPAPPSGSIANGFVLEISAAGDRLIFSTLYTGGGVTCNGSCIAPVLFPAGPTGPDLFTTPQAIALDSTGAVIIAGVTDANNLAVSPNAYAQQCNCTDDAFAGFVAKIGASGTQLIWATYLPPGASAGSNTTAFSVRAVALDSSGNIVLAGTTSAGFPVTSNALQTAYPQQGGPILGTPAAGFLAKLSSNGSGLIFATYFGGNTIGSNLVRPVANGPTAIALDSQSNIWVTGGSATVALPSKSGTALLGQDYIAGISSDGASLLSLFTAPDGAAGAGLAITSQGALAVLGQEGLILISSATPAPSVMGIVGAASFQASRAVCAREVVSLYGIDIGPASVQTAQIANGVIGNSLGGIQVLFDGVPAALLYAGPTQINAIVPSAVAGLETTAVQIVTPAGTIAGPQMPVEQTLPQVFTDINGFALAVNQDGTLNSSDHPAVAGSVVSIWLEGGGAASAAATDNAINAGLSDGQFPTSVLTNVNSVDGGFESLEVYYDGDAPALPSGMIQMNFRLPEVLHAPTGIALYEVQAGPGVSHQFALF